MMRLHSLLFACGAVLLLNACDRPESGVYQGYAEGEYVRAAPIDGGTIDAIPVKRGDRVTDGALLFQLDRTAEIANHDQAAANLASAQATFLKTGLDFNRLAALVQRGNASQADLDAARAARDAADAAAKAATAALAQADWRLARREGRAAKGGIVDDVYFRPGEYAGPGQPVVSVLPPENIKVRFFIPEPELGRVRSGDKVALSCDGCPAGLTGTIRFLSPQAEFTPPVIYSKDSQAKLVYLAEAWPDANPEALHPGQPVRVALAAAK